MRVWKDRVASKTNATQDLTLLHVIHRSYVYAASLHMHKQAVFSILMIQQHEIADVFWIFAWRKFGIPDLGGSCIFKPVFRNIICGSENNPCSRRVDRLP